MPPPQSCLHDGPPSPEVTGAICRVPSTPFSQAPWYIQPAHLCRFGVRSICESYFLDLLGSFSNPIRKNYFQRPSLLTGTGILTCFPSTTHFCLVLGADSPCADWPCAGTLGLSAREVLTPFIATHVSILASDTSSMPYGTPSQAYGTLRYHLFHKEQIRSFGVWLEPRYIFGAGQLI